MNAESKAILDEEKAIYQADPIGLIRAGYLKIRDKEANLVPLVPNSTQDKILEMIQSRRKQDRPAMLIVLKSRQVGVTTIAQATTFAFATQRSNLNALDVSDDIDGASYIFKMNEIFYEQMKNDADLTHLLPEKERSDEKRMEFAKTYSRIMIDTARNAKAGRKYTLQHIHFSEAAFFTNFKELMQALMPAVVKKKDTIFIIETTANGVNDFCRFYRKMKKAYETDPDGTDWMVLFASWKDHAEYSTEFRSEEFKLKFEASLSGKERQIQKEHGLTLEQLNWRRHMIVDSFGDDDEKFEVEFPLTDKEAFKSTARQVFPAALTNPQRSNIFDDTGKELPCKARGEIVLVDRRPSFMPDQQGFLRIYQEAQPEERYVIGADSCESALKGDEACAQVIKRSTWTQVAHLHGHLNPEDFAESLFALGLYYNRALICPERNGPGLVTLTYLSKKFYPSICHQKKSVVSDDGIWSETEEYGFHTNVKTKPLIIDQLQNALRTLLIVLKDPETLDQLDNYVVKNVNKEGHVEMGAEEGMHDDCVMALAIALHYAHQIPATNYTPIGARSMPRSVTGY